MSIGKNIKIRREELGISLKEFSQKVGISTKTLEKYENGDILVIPMNNMKKISLVLNTTIDALKEEAQPKEKSMENKDNTEENNMDEVVKKDGNIFIEQEVENVEAKEIFINEEEQLINNFNSLNEIGKRRVIAYIDGELRKNKINS